ncbi:MAG: CDP-alcohol phosphatidyltransferase family protein [Chthoniobacterales bacterium]
MAQYQPTSRRPIANVFRATAHAATQWCVRHHIGPDTISYFSIVAAAAAAISFWRAQNQIWLLFIAPLFSYVRLWFNMLDGMVALATGNASPRGEIVNDLPDRISDVLIFAAVAESGLMHAGIGYWAAIFALLTAYAGTLGHAVAGRREFGGLMSKPLRMVVLHIAAWITLACLLLRIPAAIGWLSIFDWGCVIVIAGCLQTIGLRLKRTMAALRANS